MNKVMVMFYMGKYAVARHNYDVHKTFKFNGDDILFYGKGKISAGPDSYIGSHSTIQAVEGCRVTIGRGCQISHFVHIYTSNKVADKDYSCDKSLRSGDILIGDFCWIGIKTTIVGPVTIGENTCIAANSLVNRDMPPHSIAIGVPAKVVKFKSYLSREQMFEIARDYRGILSDELAKNLGHNQA